MGWEMTQSKIYNADYMIMPDVTHINPYKVENVNECIQIGYDTTMAQMPQIKSVLAANGILL